MRIGLDGRYAEGDLVGVGKYIKSLVLELSKRGIECVIFYSKKPKYKISGINIKSVVLPKSNRIIFEQVLLPNAIRQHYIDIYHATGNVGAPLLTKTKTVLTVHDLIPLLVKDYFSYSRSPALSKSLYKARLISSINKADKIVCVSNFTKNELVKRGVRKDKIKVIYSGLNKLEKTQAVKNIYGDYILNNGGMDIRKNIDVLIKAFAKVHKVYSGLKLLITGENKKMKIELTKLVKKLKLTGQVVFTGYVNEAKLSLLIKNAKCVCYPSVMEGFGFPVLEAFSLGTPVVTSNTSSIPEIAGDAAILVKPENINEISDAIINVLRDNKLASKLIILGRKQAKMFSWKKSANEYLDLYNSI